MLVDSVEKGNSGEDISRPEEMDGAELLSTSELTLCKNLKICPQQLLIFKVSVILCPSFDFNFWY